MKSSGSPVQVPMEMCFELNFNDLRNMLPKNVSADKFYLGEQWNEYLNETIWNSIKLISECGFSFNGTTERFSRNPTHDRHEDGVIDMYLYIIFTYFQRMFNWENDAGIPHKYFGFHRMEIDWQRFLVNNPLHRDMVQLESVAEHFNVSSWMLFQDFYTRMFRLLATDVVDSMITSLGSPGVRITSTQNDNRMYICYRYMLSQLKRELPAFLQERNVNRRIPDEQIFVKFGQIKTMEKKFRIEILDADTGYGILDVNAGEEKTIVIDLNSISVSLPKKDVCSDDGLLLHECQLKCQITAIEEVCKCTPFLDQLLTNNPNKSMCNYGHYRKCLRATPRGISHVLIRNAPDDFTGDIDYEIFSDDYSNHEFKLPAEYRYVRNITKLFYNNTNLDSFECQRKCLPSCTKRIWTMTEQTIIKRQAEYYANMAVAILQFRSTTYPVFEEVPYPMEFQNFISSVGGNMGVWFGASFLSIIHIAIFSVRYVVMKMKKNSVRNSVNLADDQQLARVVYSDSMIAL